MTDKRAGADGGADQVAWDSQSLASLQNTANRPANNAQRSTPQAAADQAQAWHAQDGAEDFLGLDSELSRGAAPAAVQTATPEPSRSQPLSITQPTSIVPPSQHAGHAASNESWLMEMTEDRAAVVPPEAVDAESNADAMLNSSWSEPKPGSRKRKLTMPLVACGVLGALALVGWPMLQKAQRDSEELANQDFAKITKPSHSDSASKSLEPAPQTSIAALQEPVREPAPSSQADEHPGTVPQPSPREVASVRTPVAAPDEPASSVDGLVEVVPSQPNVSARSTSEPSAPVDVASSSSPEPAPVESESSVSQSRESVENENEFPRDEIASEDESASESEPVVVVSTPLPAPVFVNPLRAPAVEASKPVAPPAVASADARSEPAPPVASAPEKSAPEPVAAQPAPAEPVAKVVGPHFDAAKPAPQASSASFFGPVPAAGEIASAAPAASVQSVALAVEDVLLLNEGDGPMRTASVLELSGVWTQPTVPLQAIDNKTKVLTPAVGKVRVALASGELFEGGLYAVGEGCVWIDTQYGRMGLAGARVKSVLQIDTPKGTPVLGAPGSQDLAGLERVRVKTPGGVFLGKVISRDGKQTTLITDDGARLTLDSKDVEVLTQAPTLAIKKQSSIKN